MAVAMKVKDDSFDTDARKRPSVAIIIPTYNARDVIGDCLNALLKIDYPNFRIVVIDDNSKDDTVKFIEENYPEAEIFKTRKRSGFAGSVNLGIRKTIGDIVILLNMDTVVDKAVLKPLVNELSLDKEIGLVGSKIYSLDGKTLQHAGGLLRKNGISVHIGRGQFDNGQYDHVRDVDYLCGALLGFRRDIIEKVGFFDEGYKPLYYEDVDFAYRIRKKGLKVRYIPDSYLVHKENVSTGGLSDRFYYHFHRNRLRFIFKNYSFRFILSKFFPKEKHWFLNELPFRLRPILLKTYMLSIFTILGALVQFKILKIKK